VRIKQYEKERISEARGAGSLVTAAGTPAGWQHLHHHQHQPCRWGRRPHLRRWRRRSCEMNQAHTGSDPVCIFFPAIAIRAWSLFARRPSRRRRHRKGYAAPGCGAQ